MITDNERAVRMIEDTPDYYHQSAVFNAIQETNAKELDLVDDRNRDLQLQLRPATATWSLGLWEERLGLFTDVSEDMEKRRKKILARIRSGAPFSGAMIKAVVEAYTNKPVKIELDLPTGLVKIIFDEEFNTDPDLFAAVDNIIHAHLGVGYMAEWIYTGGFTYAWEYNAYNYPFKLFTNDFLAGTQPAGADGVPSTLGRIIESVTGLLQTYYTQQKAYTFAANLLAGGTEVANLSKTYSLTLETAQAYTTSPKAYKVCGALTAGTGVLI